MKKRLRKGLFLLIAFLCFSFTLGTMPAQAQSPQDAALSNLKQTAGGFNSAQGEPKDIREVALDVVVALLGFVGVIMTALFIYAGFLWMTARGDDGQVTKAKTILRNSVIGFLIVLFSYGFVTFVLRSIFSPSRGFTPVDREDRPAGSVRFNEPQLGNDGEPVVPFEGSGLFD